ncbi:uncharacterized protein YALI1_F24615g [Yarrowia lipolytica]|uniref:Uncharacterized protein n=1 Tax=Yarrowia lipolytica TaxID=4952 RepID=A0A1D8NP20_YARLL|nr:hypothetical protein YALI1_F24615g [Yarrowia lipolytica]
MDKSTDSPQQLVKYPGTLTVSWTCDGSAGGELCFHGLDVDLRRSRSDKVFDSIEYIKDHNHMTEGTVEN